jgi:hypothetical protein
MLRPSIVTLVALALVACGKSYSEGDRVGVVTKFSRKGVALKSWEGELNLGGTRAGENGVAVQNVWPFHAGDDVAPSIQKAMAAGRPVRLHYRQWLVAPVGQDSDYDVTGVEPLAP